MGMDQYLRVKTAKREYAGSTGVCSGLFSIAPDDCGMVEIGYVRKGYDQDDLISRYIAHDKPAISGNVPLDRERVDEMISEITEILETHTFDEDGGDDDSEFYTWMSETKWRTVLDSLTEFKNILQDDPDAELYYNCWY